MLYLWLGDMGKRNVSLNEGQEEVWIDESNFIDPGNSFTFTWYPSTLLSPKFDGKCRAPMRWTSSCGPKIVLIQLKMSVKAATQISPDVMSAAESWSVSWKPTIGSSFSRSNLRLLFEFDECDEKLTDRATALIAFILMDLMSPTSHAYHFWEWNKTWMHCKWRVCELDEFNLRFDYI